MLSRIYILLLVVTFAALTVDGKPKLNHNRVQNNGTVVTNNSTLLFESFGQKNISINGTNKIQSFGQGNFSINATNKTQSFGQRNATQSSDNKRSFRQKREINSAWGENLRNRTFNGTRPARQGNNKPNGTRTLPSS